MKKCCYFLNLSQDIICKYLKEKCYMKTEGKK